MSAPNWPAGLPQYVLASGYGEGFPDNVQRSQPSIGPAKTRRRSTATPWPLSASIRLTEQQYDDFRDFVREDLADGARAFNLPKQRGDTGVWLVRFKEPINVSYAAPFYEVELKLEVLP